MLVRKRDHFRQRIFCSQHEWQHYAAWLQEALCNVSDEAGLMRELRLFRRRIMVRIAWAQTLALVTEESILQQLSYLAETLIVAARDWLNNITIMSTVTNDCIGLKTMNYSE